MKEINQLRIYIKYTTNWKSVFIWFLTTAIITVLSRIVIITSFNWIEKAYPKKYDDLIALCIIGGFLVLCIINLLNGRKIISNKSRFLLKSLGVDENGLFIIILLHNFVPTIICAFLIWTLWWEITTSGLLLYFLISAVAYVLPSIAAQRIFCREGVRTYWILLNTRLSRNNRGYDLYWIKDFRSLRKDGEYVVINVIEIILLYFYFFNDHTNSALYIIWYLVLWFPTMITQATFRVDLKYLKLLRSTVDTKNQNKIKTLEVCLLAVFWSTAFLFICLTQRRVSYRTFIGLVLCGVIISYYISKHSVEIIQKVFPEIRSSDAKLTMFYIASLVPALPVLLMMYSGLCRLFRRLRRKC